MVNISAPFIRRPVATTLLTLGIVLAGIMAFRLLPVAPLPQVDIPTISVQATLPGASPEVMATSVATPLERQLGRIANVTEITSSSLQNTTRITLQFGLDRDIDGAARDVQSAINAARAQLPTSLRQNPTYRKLNPADTPVMILALTSDSASRGQMYDVASTILAQKLSQIEGIGQVAVGGSSLPAVRVELNPHALNQYGISLDDVRTALMQTNVTLSKGAIEDEQNRWQIYANDQAHHADEYRSLVIAHRDGAVVRLSDVAEVQDSVEDLRNLGSNNGKPAVLVLLYKQPNANIIETVDRVMRLLPLLKASIPTAIDVSVAMERTTTIRASLREVEKTLIISTLLVILVVFAFLRDWRAALIPSIIVPVSIIGTFAIMYVCGYSLDNFSLMALTISTGFVVDDAIVVVENISRYIEAGMSRVQATFKGAREVGFTVLSMSVSLVAVFIPLLLMGGLVGRLFREFAVVLSVTILVSLLVSLTTAPMLCAKILQNKRDHQHGRFYRVSENIFSGMLRLYEKTLAWSLRHSLLTMLILLITVCSNFYLFAVVPKGFFPLQDTGRIRGTIQADQSISFQAMEKKFNDFVSIVREDPAVTNVVGFIGGGGPGGSQRNSGTIFVTLKPLAERKSSAEQIIARLRPRLNEVAGASLFLQAVQDLPGGGRASSAQYQYTLQSDNLDELRKWAPLLIEELRKLPQLTDVNSDQQDAGLQTSLVIDRDTATRLGVNMQKIDSILYDAFGQRQVSTIYNSLNQYHVVMEVAPAYWQDPEALENIYVDASPAGVVANSAAINSLGGVAAGIASGKAVSTQRATMVPLSAFSRYETTSTPLAVNHQGQFAATTLSFNMAEGQSLSDAVTVINAAMRRIGVPATVQGNFQGTAKIFQDSLRNEPWLILGALITIYIVLGILYESYVHPFTILSTLPSAGLGAVLALLICKTPFDIVALIGVFLLIGIVKKNAIMMIDFALDAERNQGLAPREAIYQACLLRFRPILMTTVAAMLGALPLAIGVGDGAEIRRPLGISVFGGLLVSQILTLYTTPVVYLYLDRFRLWCKHLGSRRSTEVISETYS